MDFDAILEAVGSNGRYQLMIAFVTALAQVPNAMAALGAIFLAATPAHWCALGNFTNDEQQRFRGPAGEHDDYDRCHRYDTNYSLPMQEGVHRLTGLAGNVSGPTAECEQFDYDRSVYKSTIVTEVCFLNYLSLQRMN